MLVDASVGVSVMSEQQFNYLWPEYRGLTLHASDLKLQVYNGYSLCVVSACNMHDATDNTSAKLQPHILNKKGPNLLDRKWIVPLQLVTFHIHTAMGSSSLPPKLHHLQ